MQDEIRYGIIGTGMMGCEHILNINAIDGASVVAYSDPEAEPRGWAEACAPNAVGYEATADLLARDDLDALVIASPNFTHHDVMVEVVEATDLPVMLEKPMCTTVQDCRDVAAMAADRSGIVWVGLEYRYMPTVDALLSSLDHVGDVKMIAIREHRFPFLQKINHWNRFTENTGGTLVEKCCHFFDMMRLVAGADPTRIYASGGQDVNHLDERYDGRTPDILDNAFVTVDFDNGVRGLLDLSMFAEGGRHEQEISVTGTRAKLETTVPGDTVWVGPRDGSAASEVHAPLGDDVSYVGFHHGSSFREHLGFIDAIRTGGPAAIGPDAGLWSVAMGAAAHLSIERGQPVLMEEFEL